MIQLLLLYMQSRKRPHTTDQESCCAEALPVYIPRGDMRDSGDTQSHATADATVYASPGASLGTTRSRLLELPSELRVHILSFVIFYRPLVRNFLNRQNDILASRGAINGVCRVRMVQRGIKWRAESIGLDSSADPRRYYAPARRYTTRPLIYCTAGLYSCLISGQRQESCRMA